MKTVLLFALASALILAGCAATDESNDGNTTTPGGGGEVGGQVVAVGPGNETGDNDTNSTG